MGFDKQFLRVMDERLIGHLIGLLSTRFSDIMVASRTPELYEQDDVRVIEDIYPDMGPLGGIHSALKNAKSRFVFTVACDMPFISVPYMDYMMSRIQNQKYDACVTEFNGHIEPFHAFYCHSGLSVMEEDLSQGKASIYYYTRKVNTLMISQDAAARILPDWRVFTNLNTRQEYEMFRREGA